MSRAMMDISNERQFQNWMKKHFLPSIFDISQIVEVRDKTTHGIPDLMVMTTVGVMAIELKWRKGGLRRGHGFFGSHKISKLQQRFLCNWAKSMKGYAFVALGVEYTRELVICDYPVFSGWDVSDVRVNDADGSVFVEDIVGVRKQDIRKDETLHVIQQMINPVHIGD